MWGQKLGTPPPYLRNTGRFVAGVNKAFGHIASVAPGSCVLADPSEGSEDNLVRKYASWDGRQMHEGQEVMLMLEAPLLSINLFQPFESKNAATA